MREFDMNGLRLTEYQAQLFEKSVIRFSCSTKIFLRRFLHSGVLKVLDQNEFSQVSFSVDEALNEIENEFGETDYGKTKYSRESLFWIGYLYRYISYTRDISTSLLFKLFPPEMLNRLYYTYHTQDPEWCVRNLLEAIGKTEMIFDRNERLKEIIRESKTCLFKIDKQVNATSTIGQSR